MGNDPGPPGLAVIRYLFQYQHWAGERLFAAVERCDVNRWPKAIPGGQGDGSLFATLAHMVGAEQRWYQRWHGVPLEQLRSDDYTSVAQIVGEWREVQDRRRVWLDSLDAATLGGELQFVGATSGVLERMPLWQTLLHVANHTTHHRSEACVALTAHGAPPQSVDLVEFVRSRSPQGER